MEIRHGKLLLKGLVSYPLVAAAGNNEASVINVEETFRDIADSSRSITDLVLSVVGDALDQVRRHLDMHVHLPKRVTNFFGGQGVGRAWLEVYEIFATSHLAIFRSGPIGSQTRVTAFFNMADPGEAICATNHLLARSTFDWVASHGPVVADDFGIVTRHPDRWLRFPAGCRHSRAGFQTAVSQMKFWFPEGVDLYVSTCGRLVSASPADSARSHESLDDQAKSEFCRMLLGLASLKEGGTFLMYFPEFRTASTISIVQQINELFGQSRLVRPTSVEQGVPGVYLLATDYLGMHETSLNAFSKHVALWHSRMNIRCPGFAPRSPAFEVLARAVKTITVTQHKLFADEIMRMAMRKSRLSGSEFARARVYVEERYVRGSRITVLPDQKKL